MTITLKQLAHARALKLHGSFHRAARSMNISQPAFSRSISTLEEVLGTTLFNRGAGVITTTVYGDALLARADLVLNQTDEMVREIQLLQGMETGSLSVAIGVYAADMSGNSSIAEMVKRYPRLHWQAKLSSWHQIGEMVASREVDLGVAEISTLEETGHLQLEPVGKHQLMFFCRREHPLLKLKRQTRADLARYPLASVRLPPRAAVHLTEMGTTDAATGELVPSIELNDLTAMRSIVSNSDAVGIAAPVQIEAALRSGELSCLNYKPAWLRLDYGVIYLRNRMLSPIAQEYIRVLRHIDAQHGKTNIALMKRYASGSASTVRGHPWSG